MSGKSLQHLVNLELDTAVFENEYTNLMTDAPAAVAQDLLLHSPVISDLHDTTEEEVSACVRSYQMWYKTRPKG